jgi:Tfp pilus assembly protein PilF
MLAAVARAQQPAPDPLQPNTPAANAPAAAAMPTVSGPNQLPSDPAFLMHQAIELMQQKQFDAAMEKVNAAIQADPQNVDGYGLRGGLYAQKKQWDNATKDYQHIIQMQPDNDQAKFNLSEIDFLQKKYDQARVGFAALESNREAKDLASYKVFLCDLLAGHEDVAAKELADMDQDDRGASFYFAKAAWALYHKQPDDARTWLNSAANIYSQAKFKVYSASLFDLGYLPLPLPQKS